MGPLTPDDDDDIPPPPPPPEDDDDDENMPVIHADPVVAAPTPPSPVQSQAQVAPSPANDDDDDEVPPPPPPEDDDDDQQPPVVHAAPVVQAPAPAPTPPVIPLRPRGFIFGRRAPSGSPPQSTTFTLNTPKICYVHNLYIREEWNSEDPPPPPLPPDKIEDVEKKIEDLRAEVDKKQKEFDDKVLNPPAAFNFDTEQSEVNKYVRDKEIDILNLEIKRGQIVANQTTVEYQPPSALREFIIVKEITPDIEDRRKKAEADLTVTRNKLNIANDEWLKLHKEHEETKQKLAGFLKKKRQLNEERKNACQAYENSRSKKKKKQAKLKPKHDQAEFESGQARRDLNAATANNREALTKKNQKAYEAFQKIKKEYLDAGAETGDEREAKKKFEEAKKKYNDFTDNEYKNLNDKRKEDYKKLTAKAKDIVKITDDLTKAEKDKQEAINTLKTGSVIQMVGFAKNDSMKSADVTLNANKVGKLKFEEKYKKFFNTSTHSNTEDNNRHHPFLMVNENGKLLQTELNSTKFSPYELHELLVAAKKAEDKSPGAVNKPEGDFFKGIRSVFSGGMNSLGNIKEFFRNLGSDPQTRDYQIAAKTCGTGVKPTDLPNDVFARLTKELGVEIKTFPADTYTLTITAKPLSKIGEQKGEKRNMSTGAVDPDSDPVKEKWGVSQIQKEDKPLDFKQGATQAETDKNRATAQAEADEAKLLDTLRVPNQTPILQNVPIDISLKRNKYEDPITDDLRKTVGLVLFLAQKCSDLFSRLGNIVPSVGWKIGFEASFLTGKLSYTDEWKEHTDWRVWHHRKFDLDLNIVTVKGFFFGGISIDVLLVMIECGIEIYIKGSFGVKGSVENMHPDVKKLAKIGFGPTGGVGVGAEIRAVIGRPDWVKASATVESALTAEAIWYAMSDKDGAYMDYKFGWEGVSFVALCHVALIGHWEKKVVLAKPRDIKSGRYPDEIDTEKLLTDLGKQRDEDMKEALEEAKELEKKRKKLEKEKLGGGSGWW